MRLPTGPATTAVAATVALLMLTVAREAGWPLFDSNDAAAWLLLVPAYVTVMAFAGHRAEVAYDKDQRTKKAEAQNPGEAPQERSGPTSPRSARRRRGTDGRND